jgi:hypothetical protein
MVFVFQNTERSVIISVILFEKRDGTYTTPPVTIYLTYDTSFMTSPKLR